MSPLQKIFYRIITVFSIIAVSIPLLFDTVQAKDTAIRAVLFHSPSCGHCLYVLEEVLPPLESKYQNRLQILKIDVSTPEGQQYYQAAVKALSIPGDRVGVPALVIGNSVLVGDKEIPNELPGIIESRLKSGGTDWPAIPGISTLASNYETQLPSSQVENDNWFSSAISKFKRDIYGNSLAILILIAMLASVIYLAVRFIIGYDKRPTMWPNWVVPALATAGLAVAIYLTFVETTKTTAICGPVGDCNSVQQSPYAYLFGIIPVGVLGALGYISILIAWLVYRFSPSIPVIPNRPILMTRPQRYAWLAIWGMSWFGVLFSIYLTFLEPFVIGATCIWCITSAIIMTLLLWCSTPHAIEAMSSPDLQSGRYYEPDTDHPR